MALFSGSSLRSKGLVTIAISRSIENLLKLFYRPMNASRMDVENNEAFDYAELKESANWKQNGSRALGTMDRLYFESLV